MEILIGTMNDVKIEALKDAIKDYQDIKDADIIGVKTGSGVSDQPKTLDETIQGAINRAEGCYRDGCMFSVGIESGLMEVQKARTGYIENTVCAIYDGEKTAIGLSSGFECPEKIIECVKDGKDLNDATKEIGLTSDERIGSKQGLIGLLTRGRIIRKHYTTDAIIMALIQIENKGLY